MERELLFTGVGGQGVQICSKTLAQAATAEGRYVMLTQRYGGSVRGGRTNAEVTIGDAPLRALPIADSAWSGFAMSSRFWESIRPRLRPGALIVVNTELFDVDADVPDATVLGVDADAIAVDLGNKLAAGFVLLGAYAAITSIVALDSLVAAMRTLIPPYRQQHIALNEAALQAGFDAAGDVRQPAWLPAASAPANTAAAS